MNHLLSISELKRRYGRFRLLLLVLLSLAVVLLSGFWLGAQSLANEQRLVREQKLRLDELYQQLDEQGRQLNFLKVEMAVDKQAAEHVKEQLQTLHQENFKLQKDLAFYQKVMAPEFEADGVEVDQFHINPSGSERVYHYKLVLVQTQKQKRFAKGFVKLSVSGSLNDQSKHYELEQLIEDFDEQMWQFSFRYFKILEGDFTLPQGFMPQRVHVTAILPASKWQKHARLDRQYRFFPEQAF